MATVGVTQAVRPRLRLVDGQKAGGRSRFPSRGDHPSLAVHRRAALYIGGEPDAGTLLRHLEPQREPVRFLVAREGKVGRQMAIDQIPRIVVVEESLPDVDVAALVTEFRHQIVPPRVPIIVLARDGTPDERARFMWAGASAYVSEPLDRMFICRTVGMLLDSSSWR